MRMRLVIASNNKHKIAEIKQMLSGYWDDVAGLEETGLFYDVEEDGDTFAQNAVKKALVAMEKSGCAALADDSGLVVDALGGAPGVHSARYAGEHGDDAANNALVLDRLREKDLPWRARFVCALALARPQREVLIVEGRVEGEIQPGLSGQNGFGYDPLFKPDGYAQTFGVLPESGKNKIIHRAAALAALREALEREG
jgi:XTP/dITP diphosphohydrolase